MNDHNINSQPRNTESIFESSSSNCSWYTPIRSHAVSFAGNYSCPLPKASINVTVPTTRTCIKVNGTPEKYETVTAVSCLDPQAAYWCQLYFGSATKLVTTEYVVYRMYLQIEMYTVAYKYILVMVSIIYVWYVCNPLWWIGNLLRYVS